SGNGQPNPRIGRLFVDKELRDAVERPEDSYAGFSQTIGNDLSAAEAVSLMYLHINDGAVVAAFRNCLRGYAEMALPYLDGDFLELVLGTRVSDRSDSTIHHHLIRTLCPPLMRIANSNTGVPLDASRLRLAVTGKILTLLRRLRVPGFRHYHYLEVWM